jgi:hypothetical protein
VTIFHFRTPTPRIPNGWEDIFPSIFAFLWSFQERALQDLRAFGLQIKAEQNAAVFVGKFRIFRCAAEHGIGEQKQLQLTVFVQPRSENFGIGEQKQLKLTVFVQPRSEKFRNWRTKATQIDSICSAAQRKISELANKSNSN